MRAEKSRMLAVLAAAPFIVATCLVILMISSPWTGMTGPSSNVFFASGAAAIIAALVAAIVALCLMGHRALWVRILVGLSYGPVVLPSLLLIGA